MEDLVSVRMFSPTDNQDIYFPVSIVFSPVEFSNSPLNVFYRGIAALTLCSFDQDALNQ